MLRSRRHIFSKPSFVSRHHEISVSHCFYFHGLVITLELSEATTFKPQTLGISMLNNCIYAIWFIYRVVCKCGSCGPERKALSEWERHTGSKAKNWRTSVKVKSSKLPLEEWVCTNFLIFSLGDMIYFF